MAIKYAGVAYLFFLAWRMWTAPAVARGDAVSVPSTSPMRMFLAGLAVTLGNPKIMVFYMALLPTIIDLHRVTVFGWGELMLTAVAVLIMVDLCWTGLAVKARKLLTSRRAVRMVNRGSAAVMAGAAVAMATR
jgi:threonine/homoserine/homoserine lactone efflux protein